jgi:hypothetical protein
MYSWRDLVYDLFENLRQKVPISAVIALGSAGLWGLERLASGSLETLLLVLYVLGALLAGGIGLIEVVAQSERWRLVAFAAMAYGVLAVIFTIANSIAGIFPHTPPAPH